MLPWRAADWCAAVTAGQLFYRCSYGSMALRLRGGGGGWDSDVRLVYLYEVPRTYEAVNFSNGA